MHKITGKPAARYGLKQRGLLKPGYYADIVAFRADAVDSPATYESPELDPIGIEFVYPQRAVRAVFQLKPHGENLMLAKVKAKGATLEEAARKRSILPEGIPCP